MTHGEVCAGGLPNTQKDTTVGKFSAFLFGRLRLNIGYQRPHLELRAVIENKAVWGTNNNIAIGLYEGWAKVHGKGFFAQLGRVALSYDDERIIGPNDFAMAAKSHDIIRVGYEGFGHKLHLIAAYNQVGKNVLSSTFYENGAQYYKTMQALWYHYDIPTTFPWGFSVLAMNVGMQAGEKGKNEHLEWQQLIGGYIRCQPQYVTVEGAYYHQLGHTQSGAKLNAFMGSVKADIHPSDQYGFVLGYDYLSGDDYVSVPRPGEIGLVFHGTERGFNPLYGSRTKFYGILDYFYESAYINGFTPGLQNAYFTVYGTPVKGLSLRGAYHYLAVATDLEGLKRTLGHSAEFKISYRFNHWLSLTASYSLMYGTETMNRLKMGSNDKFAHWGWFSFVVNPTIFEAQWFDKKKNK